MLKSLLMLSHLLLVILPKITLFAFISGDFQSLRSFKWN